MQVTLDRLEQSYSLNGGQTLTYLILTLPSGEVVKAQVTDDAARKLIEASVAAVATEVGEDSFSLVDEAPPEPPGVVYDKEDEDEELEWAELPDDVLAPVYKQIMLSMSIPRLISLKRFETLVDEISSHLMSQAAKAKAPQQPVSQPGSPHVIPRQRRVAADEMGYPVVSGLRSPQSVEQGRDSDEDGVSQL